jgi:hypothetical protein
MSYLLLTELPAVLQPTPMERLHSFRQELLSTHSPSTRYRFLHYSHDRLALVDDSQIIIVNVETEAETIKTVDSEAGVHFSGQFVTFARSDSIFVYDLFDSVELFVHDLDTFRIIGLRDDVVGLYGRDSIFHVSSRGEQDGYYFPYSHRRLAAQWDDSVMLVLGSDTTVVNRLYQVDLVSQVTSSLGTVEGFNNIMVLAHNCGELYIASTPVGIRKYVQRTRERFLPVYSYANVNTSILSISQVPTESVSVVTVADAPVMPSQAKKVYSVTTLNSVQSQSDTRVVMAQEEGDYPQVVLSEDNRCRYLVTNKRVCNLDSSNKTLWRSSELLTSACLTPEAVIVGSLSGVYRVHRGNGDVDTLMVVDSDMYVPIHISADPSSGLIIMVESNPSKAPRRRHRVIDGSESTLLSVPEAEKYSASFLSNGYVLFIGQQTIGTDRVTHIQRGSIFNASYTAADSTIIPFPVSPQAQSPGRVYCIGAAYKSLVLDINSDPYHVYEMADPNQFSSAFTVASILHDQIQYFGANFSYAPKLVQVRIDTTVSSLWISPPDSMIQSNSLTLSYMGASICLQYDGIQVEGRISLYKVNGSKIADVMGECLAPVEYGSLASGLLFAVGQYKGDRCVSVILSR